MPVFSPEFYFFEVIGMCSTVSERLLYCGCPPTDKLVIDIVKCSLVIA
jgi:hypothetical protein